MSVNKLSEFIDKVLKARLDFPSGGKYEIKKVDGTTYVDSNQPADIKHRYEAGKQSDKHHKEQEQKSREINLSIEHILLMQKVLDSK